MLVKHYRIINKRDTVQPLLKLTEAHDIFLIYADSEIIFSRCLAYLSGSRLTNSKRESDQNRRGGIELPFTFDLGELLSTKRRVVRIQ